MNQIIVYEVIQTLAIVEGSKLDFFYKLNGRSRKERENKYED